MARHPLLVCRLLIPMLLLSMAVDARQAPPFSLTSALAAHSLPFDQARKGLPVHLRGVVTEYDPFTDPKLGALFLCDGAGCICVLTPPRPVLPIHAGSEVEVDGVSDPGHYAPVVDASAVRAIGEARLPASRKATITQLLTGAYDAKWVEVEGVVRDVRTSAHNATLTLGTADGIIRAVSPLEPGADYSRLVDARVLVRGNAAPVFNQNREMVWVRLLFPSLRQLIIEEPAPKDPFSNPLRAISGLMLFNGPKPALARRVRVRGHVTLDWPGQSLFVQDGGKGLFIASSRETPIEPGALVDAVGFPAAGEYSSMLQDSVLRVTGPAAKVAAAPINAGEALSGNHDAQLVRMRGELVSRNLLPDHPALAVASSGTVFMALLPPGIDTRLLPDWRTGSELEVTGVLSVQVDGSSSSEREGAALPKSFRILLRSPEDVTVIHAASWWTPSKCLVVVTLFLAVILAGFFWVSALRQRVEERTATIRATLESAGEGILVIDSSRRITAHNRKFEVMWSIGSAEIERADYGGLLRLLSSRMAHAGDFAGAWGQGRDAAAKTNGAIELKDGRVFECQSEPQTVNGKNVGRVWSFRDATESRTKTRLLEHLANVDSLTGVRNRRSILELAGAELKAAAAAGEPLTLIMADLDWFKSVNDRYGHTAGDVLLKEAAERLGSQLRSSDALGRYGGEEFLLVLPRCAATAAKTVAEQLRAVVERRPAMAGMEEIPMTCSFGVSIAGHGNYDLMRLLRDADTALYVAKQAGRNRVIVAGKEAALIPSDGGSETGTVRGGYR